MLVMEGTAPRLVTCPTCRGPSVFAPANRWRPFCSDTCRAIDLGDWASERFRLPATAADPASAAPQTASDGSDA